MSLYILMGKFCKQLERRYLYCRSSATWGRDRLARMTPFLGVFHRALEWRILAAFSHLLIDGGEVALATHPGDICRACRAIAKVNGKACPECEAKGKSPP